MLKFKQNITQYNSGYLLFDDEKRIFKKELHWIMSNFSNEILRQIKIAKTSLIPTS